MNHRIDQLAEGYPRRAVDTMRKAFDRLDSLPADVPDDVAETIANSLAEEILLAWNAGYRTTNEIVALLADER